MIEALHMDGTRIRSQRTVTAQIEINIEITERQLAQSPVDRLAIAASRVIRLGDGAPMAIDLIYGKNMIGIVFGFEVHDEWRISICAQGRCGKKRSLVAMRCVFRQDPPR